MGRKSLFSSVSSWRRDRPFDHDFRRHSHSVAHVGSDKSTRNQLRCGCLVVSWRNIAITLKIPLQNRGGGEQTAQACAMAWFHQLPITAWELLQPELAAATIGLRIRPCPARSELPQKPARVRGGHFSLPG